MLSPSQNDSTPSQESVASSESIYRSPQQRKEALRQCYVNAKALQNNINKKTIDNLERIMDETDVINKEGTLEEKIENQEEVILDSKVMSVSSNVMKKCSSSITKDISCYDPIEFAEKIQQHVKRMPDTLLDENIDWSLLGKRIFRCFKITAKFTMILGTLRQIPKKEVVRRKYVREAQAQVKRPENVITLDKVEDSVEETVSGIQKLMSSYKKQHNKPLDFFLLVLHPTSYGKTIENMLHVSFLVRDGFVKFTIDEDGIPYVQKCKNNPGAETSSRNKQNIQNVLSLNMHQWKALVEAYGIEKPMIDFDSKKTKNTK